MNNREYSGISEHNIFRILKNRKYQRMPKGSVFEHQLSKLSFYCNGDGTLSVYGPSSGEPKEGIQIPGFVYGMKVVHICERAFEYQTNLRLVLLPETIISIGDRAFASCSMLYKVLVKGVVQSIGREAFADCIRLREILFPEYKPVKYENSSGNNITSDIHYIGDSAFCNCVSIEKIRIPDQCSRIEKNAFSGCIRLRLIALPFSISSIDNEAFTNTNLEEIHAEYFTKDKWREFVKQNNFFIEAHIFLMEGDNDGIININGITFFVDLQKEETVVVGCDPSATSLVIPRVVGGFPVKSIGARAFNSCKLLKQITIPDTISQINKKIFPYFSVISEIYAVSFSKEEWRKISCNCDFSNKATVFLKDGCRDGKIEVGGLTYLTDLNNRNRYVKKSTNDVTEVHILGQVEGDPVTGIGPGAFSLCTNLLRVSIPSSVQFIGKRAFSGCSNLVQIRIPDAMTVIEEGLFAGCSGLTEVVLPSSIKSIKKHAFDGCINLKHVVIPDGDISIEESAFDDCNNISCITIASGVETIEGNCFKFSNKPSRLTIPKSVKKISKSAIPGISLFEEIYADSFSPAAWKKIIRNVTFPNGTDVILINGKWNSKKTIDGLHYSFDSKSGNWFVSGIDSNISEVIIQSEVEGDRVIAIGKRAFFSCKNLKKIVMPDNVISIGEFAFKGCSNLEQVVMHESVDCIGRGAFWGCENLKEISLSKKLIAIKDWTFRDCSELTSINIPDSVSSIGRGAFSGCKKLSGIEISNGLEVIKEDTFKDCCCITSFEIPKSVKKIEKEAFLGCIGLITIIIPNSVLAIDDNVFSGCTSLRSIVIPDSLKYIGNYSTFGCKEIFAESFTKKKWRSLIKGKDFESHSSVFLKDGEKDGLIEKDGITYILQPDHKTRQVAKCSNDINKAEIMNMIAGDPVTKIDIRAFLDCTILTSLIIPDSVISCLSPPLFNGCQNLRSITFGKGISTIGGYPFYGLEKLECINVSEENSNYKSVDGVLFDKTGQTLIKYPPEKSGSAYQIPESVSSINEYAFINCKYLHSIVIPSSIISIGKNSLLDCPNLKLIDVMQHENNISGAPWGAYNAMVKWN